MSKATVAILVFFGLAAPASAQAAHKHPKRCTHGRVLKVERVARHRHGKTVHVKVRYCAKKKKTRPKPATVAPATIPPPTAAAAAPAKTVKLHAHLDPTVTRNPSNPFAVSYAYSASATSEPVGTFAVSSEPVPLPPGVLTLYNEGLLACSINVGGQTTGGECPVEYKTLGEHTVTTIYTAGEASATETETENIEPYATSTTVSASYEHLSVSQKEGTTDTRCASQCVYKGDECTVYGSVERITTTWLVGYLKVDGVTADANESLPAPLLAWGGHEVVGEGVLPVHAEEIAEPVASCAGTVYTEKAPAEAIVLGSSTLSAGFASSQASAAVALDARIAYPEGEQP